MKSLKLGTFIGALKSSSILLPHECELHLRVSLDLYGESRSFFVSKGVDDFGALGVEGKAGMLNRSTEKIESSAAVIALTWLGSHLTSSSCATL